LTPALLGLSATDDVDGAVAVTLSTSSAGLGSTSVTARATDSAGNSSTRTFTVRVLDVTAPVIDGPTPATPTFEWRGSPIRLLLRHGRRRRLAARAHRVGLVDRRRRRRPGFAFVRRLERHRRADGRSALRADRTRRRPDLRDHGPVHGRLRERVPGERERVR